MFIGKKTIQVNIINNSGNFRISAPKTFFNMRQWWLIMPRIFLINGEKDIQKNCN